jgi:hypothetical protein
LNRESSMPLKLTAAAPVMIRFAGYKIQTSLFTLYK